MDQDNNKSAVTNQKVTWQGWLSFLVLVVLFSGAFANADGFLKAFDFGNLTGTFGKISGSLTFIGKGGTGAREGMLYGLTLIPTVMLAVGLIDVVEAKGGLRAAENSSALFSALYSVSLALQAFLSLPLSLALM